jgi:hypothetical protein
MGPMPGWILPAWVDIPNWLPRFESTVYYGLSCGKRVLDHTKALAANLPPDSPLASSPEFVKVAAMSAARRINGVCLCVAADERKQPYCKEQCKRLCSLTRVPEALFAPLANELLVRTFGTDNIPAISEKLREYTKIKLP